MSSDLDPGSLAGASAGGAPAEAAADGPVWCDQCGEDAAQGEHAGCAARRRLEPPRYCASCRRRMVVQVLPRGWSARCSRHGTMTG